VALGVLAARAGVAAPVAVAVRLGGVLHDGLLSREGCRATLAASSHTGQEGTGQPAAEISHVVSFQPQALASPSTVRHGQPPTSHVMHM
jgi:hypothetical protein